MSFSPVAFQLAAFIAIATGAASLYLSAPNQRWLSRPLPAQQSRVVGAALLLLGGQFWSQAFQLSTAIFITLTLSMILFIIFSCLGALSILFRNKS